MLDLTWKVFSQTGNIETYLLLKELENGEELLQEHSKAIENKQEESVPKV